MAIQRLVAKKIWISNLAGAPYVKKEGFEPNYVEVNGNQISRVNVIATVVSKFVSEDGNYAALTLDDGTDTIRAKAFGPDVLKIKNVEVGKLVLFIGKVREYNDELYLSPEVIKEIDNPNWLIVRQLELGEPKVITKSDEPKAEQKEEVEEMTIENPTDKVIELIKELDNGEGAEIEKIIEKMGLDETEVKNIIVGILKSGDIFEPRKGKLKVLE